MNKTILILGTTLATLFSGCASTTPGSGSDLGSGSQAVVLDQRCAADTDCPNGFACETEISHGPEASYCVSDDSEGTSNGQCPAGYELESEHGETLCKAHGGSNHGSGGSDDSGAGGSDDNGGGGSDDNGGSGGAPEGAACLTSEDCAPGLECETEIENGVSTSSCKVHG